MGTYDIPLSVVCPCLLCIEATAQQAQEQGPSFQYQVTLQQLQTAVLQLMLPRDVICSIPVSRGNSHTAATTSEAVMELVSSPCCLADAQDMN